MRNRPLALFSFKIPIASGVLQKAFDIVVASEQMKPDCRKVPLFAVEREIGVPVVCTDDLIEVSRHR
jgi:hypothetical protein